MSRPHSDAPLHTSRTQARRGTRIARAVILAALAAPLGLPAIAAPMTITADASFDSVSGGFPGDATISVVGTFTPFDPALGTLVSVAITSGGLGGGSIRLRSLEPGYYSAQLRSETVVLGPDGTVIDRVSEIEGGLGFAIADDGTPSYPQLDTGTPFEAFVTEGNSFARPLNDVRNDLHLFLSETTFTVARRYFYVVEGAMYPGNVAVFSPDTVSLQMSVPNVQYTYLPVPEPGTASLVGLGFGVLAAARSGKRGVRALR
jgi:hypothetical protein